MSIINSNLIGRPSGIGRVLSGIGRSVGIGREVTIPLIGDFLITDTGDFLVTDTGDNLIWM